MQDAPYQDWRDEFVLARDVRSRGGHAELVQAVRARRLVPVIRGAYRRIDAVRRAIVAEHPRDDAFRARIRAAHLLASAPPTFAGFAAAAIWRLPILGDWPPMIDVLVDPSTGGRSNATLRRSYVGWPGEYVEVDGLRVTPLSHTVVATARTASFAQAVAFADAGLHGADQRGSIPARKPVTRADLLTQLTRFGGGRGVRKARGALDFADGASGSAGESASRVGIRLLGMPKPQLQVPFSDDRGHIGTVDFWWPEFNLIGEFDGEGKYLRDEFTQGRTAAEVVIDEKNRENRLRALGPSLTRWDWPVARSLILLRAHLAAAGLR
ncbi:MAG: hypothetical protein JWQ39_820 [Glaciihabitans sp.]|nr:hypothetical protein [Glaciihabitans sp.]